MNGSRWNWKVIDIKGAYLNADYKGNVNHLFTRLNKNLTAIYVQLYPKYKHYVHIDGTMIVQIDKAFYGLVESSLL